MILIALITAVSLICLIPLYTGEKNGYAYVYVRGSLYGTYPLDEPQEIILQGNRGMENVIAIDGNSVYMKSASCPGRQCIKRGRISRRGESICCAPAGILVMIESGKRGEYDAVTN